MSLDAFLFEENDYDYFFFLVAFFAGFFAAFFLAAMRYLLRFLYDPSGETVGGSLSHIEHASQHSASMRAIIQPFFKKCIRCAHS